MVISVAAAPAVKREDRSGWFFELSWVGLDWARLGLGYARMG